MNKAVMGLLALICLAGQAFADTPPVKIADCELIADAHNKSGHLEVLLNSGDESEMNALSVQLDTSSFPVQQLEWTDGRGLLAIRFANYLIANIHNGHSADNTLGVTLAPPQMMTCDANF